MSRRRAAAVLVACAMAVTVTACGRDDESTSTGGPPPTSEAPPASVSPPSTTQPVTTTTAVVTTAPPTTPPTTTFDLATVQAQVEADYREAVAAFRRAQHDPTNPTLVNEALSWRLDPSRGMIADVLGSMAAATERILPEPLTEPSIVIESPAEPSASDPNLVEIVSCDTDPWVLVEIGTGPGGTDAVIDDNTYSYRNVTRLRLIDGLWRVEEGIEIGTWTGAATCGPA